MSNLYIWSFGQPGINGYQGNVLPVWYQQDQIATEMYKSKQSSKIVLPLNNLQDVPQCNVREAHKTIFRILD